MKQSEVLYLEAAQEDNDLKAMGIRTKAIREARFERFEEHWLEDFKKVTTVTERPNGSYSMEVPGEGIVDFFPKKNSLLIRKKNKWEKPALAFLMKHFGEKLKNLHDS